MKIAQVHLKGFRNFKDVIVNLENKTLIIGSNDVGKTNFLYALRLLLDRSLSEQDIEPEDNDFYVHEPTHEFLITLQFTEVTDNIRAAFKEYVNDKDELYLQYQACRDEKTGKKTFQILAGWSLETLEEQYRGRYIKALNIKYISSYRDLLSYIRRERKGLMQEAKEMRSNEEIDKDNVNIADIKRNINQINTQITDIQYIKQATKSINEELNQLSFHHYNQNIVFSIGGSDIESFVDSAQLTSLVNGKNLTLGGDGRNNQIFLALWAAKNALDKDPAVTTIFAIEEPEAHLHPQQQRKLAEYLANKMDSQVILTSHSPHILSMFSPNAIVRFFQKQFETKVANNGCGKIIDDAFNKFGYRRSIISAEAFFANVVFLVEGASEVVFYTALGQQLIDLDKYNISILMADGVGFEPYIKILNALEIPFVLRTDNDIMKIPHSDPEKFRYAGVQRSLGFAKEKKQPLIDLQTEKESFLKDFARNPIPSMNEFASQEFIESLTEYNIYVANSDLETDFVKSDCFAEISAFFDGETNPEKLVKKMQEAKATFIFNFLQKYGDCLRKLASDALSAPLFRCQTIVQEIFQKA